MDDYHRSQKCLWCGISMYANTERWHLSTRDGIKYTGINKEPDAKHVYFCSGKHSDEFEEIAKKYINSYHISSLGWYIYNHHIVSWYPPVRDKLNDKNYHLYGFGKM